MAAVKVTHNEAATTSQVEPTLYSLGRGDLGPAGQLTLQQLSNLLLSIRDDALLDKNERMRLLETVDDFIWKRSQNNG